MREKTYDDTDDKAFARRLRLTRAALGLTEEEAATAAGRTVETWKYYETLGRGRITEALIRFTRKYRVEDLRWLLCGEGQPPHLINHGHRRRTRAR